jgi:EmrB/QacA subfamily drug resistance transporter
MHRNAFHEIDICRYRYFANEVAILKADTVKNDTVHDETHVSARTKLSIGATALLSFVGVLTETSLNVTFPTMTKEFGLPLSTIQLLTSGYLLMVTLVMSTSSFLLKRFDARLLFRLAIATSLAGTVLCSIPADYWVLLVGRLLQAAATGVSTPLMMHVILSLIPQRRRGTYMGIAGMVISLAPTLGPTYGGLINYYWSWHIIFVLTVPLLLLSYVLGELYLRLSPRSKAAQHFDALGLVLLTFALVSLTQIFDRLGASGTFNAPVLIAIAATVVAFALLIWHSISSHAPLLNGRLLKTPTVGLRAINFFILQFINIGSSFLIPVFAELFLGANSMHAGLLLLPGSLLGALITPFAGSLYDRHGAALPLLVSNISMLIGVGAFWWLTGNLTLPLITGLYLFLKLGFNLGYSNTMSDGSKYVTAEQQTDFNSMFNTFQQYAGSLGTSVLACSLAISQIALPGDPKHAAVEGTSHGFMLLIALAFVALVATLVSVVLRHKPPIRLTPVKV